MRRLLSRQQLDEAVRHGIVTPTQAEQLWQMLAESGIETPQPGNPRFTFTNVLYYLGGMLAIGAMTLFMSLGWEAFGGWGIVATALAYAALALGGARSLKSRDLPVPAGILAALAIALVPLAIYGLQLALGWWPPDRPYRDYHYWIDWRWATMEVATLVSGAVVLALYRLPFAMMPVAVTLWYMSMDFAPLLAEGDEAVWHLRSYLSIGLGLMMTSLAIWIDTLCRRKPDFGFWLWFFGVLAFWGGLSMLESESEAGRLAYAGLNAAMIFLGAIVQRRILTVLGGLGVFGYLGHLSYQVFKDSVLFPFALTALGLALVVAGVWWQRHEAAISARFRQVLPAGLRAALDGG